MEPDSVIHGADSSATFVDFSVEARRRLLTLHMSHTAHAARAPFHDAGDFLRGEPMWFGVDYLPTPYRHVLAPAGLWGIRSGVVIDGRSVAPLDHVAEPDGQIDMNDLPSAWYESIATVYGPLGSFLGATGASHASCASGAVGTLIAESVTPDKAGPAQSRLEIQKGAYGYANTKGMVAESLSAGYAYAATLEYRKIEPIVYPNDDSYHQRWRVTGPVGRRARITGEWRLYKRDAAFIWRPTGAAQYFDRSRYRSDARAEMAWALDSSTTARVSYSHLGDNAKLRSSQYGRAIETTNDGAHVSLDAVRGSAIYRFYADGASESFRTGAVENSRHSGAFGVRGMKSSDSSKTNMFAEAGGVYTGGYFVIPRALAGIVTKKKEMSFAASIGVTPVFPRQYELDLPARVVAPNPGPDYLAERGAEYLRPERHYTAAAQFGVGAEDNDLRLALTGGRIVNAVVWRSFSEPTGGQNTRPINETVSYMTLGVTKNIRLAPWFHVRLAGVRFWRSYDSTATPRYSPRWNVFASGHMERHISAVGVTMSGFARAGMADRYLTADGTELGLKPFVDASLSARIKGFAFHYVFENVLDRIYAEREQYNHLGRYTWYWFTWDFLD